MKKIFTTLFCVSILLGSSVHLSAQTTLTNAEKQQLQKEILPVVFKQISQQLGLDVLSLTQPEKLLENVLRADDFVYPLAEDWTHTPMDIQMDSVIIPLSTPVMGISTIKLTFENFNPIELPTIGRFPITYQMPQIVKVGGSAMIDGLNVAINLKPIASSATIISGLDITLSSLLTGELPLVKLTFEKLPTKAFSDYLAGFNLNINIDGIRSTLKDPTLGAMIGGILPDGFALPEVNFLITIVPQLAAGVIDASIYGIPVAAPTMQVPMGDAKVELTQTMSLRCITLTSYIDEDGDGMTDGKGWRRLWPNMEQVNAQDLVLTVNDFRYTSEAMTDSVYQGSTIYTMSDYTSQIPTSKALVTKAIENVVALLKADQPTWYKMVVEEVDQNNKKEISSVVEIIPYMEGANAIARLLIHDYEDGAESDLTELRATASLQSEKILVEVLDAAGKSSANMYFTSNALNVMGSEAAPEVSDISIATTDGGIYITNADGALYSIVNMGGATIASGTVNGNYIQAPLAKGVYILVVKEKNKTQSFKFAK